MEMTPGRHIRIFQHIGNSRLYPLSARGLFSHFLDTILGREPSYLTISFRHTSEPLSVELTECQVEQSK